MWLSCYVDTSLACLTLVALHEDVERLERLVVKDLRQETKTYKAKLMQQHRVRKRLDQMQESSRKLVRRSQAAF